MGVTQIAKETNINPSTCYNLLKTLVHERIVTFDPKSKGYAVGLGLVEIARGCIERASFARLARPYLNAIATEFNVTTMLWQRSPDDRMILVELAETNAAMRVHMNVGQRLPLFIGAFGRCMAARSTLSKVALRRAFDTLRWQDAPAFNAWLQEVKAAGSRGFAVDVDHYVRGVTTVAASVAGADDAPVMAVSAVGFSAQFGQRELISLAEAVRDTALRLGTAAGAGTAAT